MSSLWVTHWFTYCRDLQEGGFIFRWSRKIKDYVDEKKNPLSMQRWPSPYPQIVWRNSLLLLHTNLHLCNSGTFQLWSNQTGWWVLPAVKPQLRRWVKNDAPIRPEIAESRKMAWLCHFVFFFFLQPFHLFIFLMPRWADRSPNVPRLNSDAADFTHYFLLQPEQL